MINKLLFYADFKFYKEQGLSITGSRYAHLPYGPVFDNFNHLLAMMIESEKSLNLEERPFDTEGDNVGLWHKSIEEPDMSLFSLKEIDTMKFVKEYFQDFGSKKIADFSHKEEGYKLTSDGDYISYKYAASLQI